MVLLRIRPGVTLFVALSMTAACSDDTSSNGGAGGSGAGPSDGGSGATSPAGGGGSSSDGGAGAGASGGGGGEQNVRSFVYVGTGDGTIERYELVDPVAPLQSLGSVPVGEHPSFLAASPDHTHLYAVDEGASEVVAFAIDPTTGDLTELNRQSSEGSGPAHLSVDATGDWVLVSNYGGGTVAVLPVQPDGSLAPAVDVEAPGENAHQIRASPSNDHVFVPCLGSDYVARYSFDDATGQLDELLPPAILPAGTGPRHLDFHPTLPIVYVIGELGDTLTTFQADGNGGLTELATVSTLPEGTNGSSNACADVHVHPDGLRLYGSNRGDDSIATFTLDASGIASFEGVVPTDGDWPRNFAVADDGSLVLVANQHTDEIVTFRVTASGDLEPQPLATTPTGSGPAWVGVVSQPR